MKNKTYTLKPTIKERDSSFEELKKKFNNWKNNPTKVSNPENEIIVEPKNNKYKISKVISKQGNLCVNYKYLTTIKNIDSLNKWRKLGYKINYCFATLPFLK